MAARDQRIKKITLPNGSVRWEFCTTIRKPDGTSGQARRRFLTYGEAEAELSKLTADRHAGKVTARWDGSVADVIAEFLASNAVRKLQAGSRANYHLVLKPAVAALGSKKARLVTRADVEAVLNQLAVSRSPWTVKATLGRLSQAFDAACRDHGLAVNPCQYAQLPEDPDTEADETTRTTWTDEQQKQFLASVTGDRLHALWRLSGLGMRRGEVLGARWDAVSYEPVNGFAGKLVIGRRGSNRVHVYLPDEHRTTSLVKGPKSRRGERTVYLDADDVAALRTFHALQARERLAAGPAYSDTGLIGVDELGAPLNVRTYTRRFYRLAHEAGLRPCGPYSHCQHEVRCIELKGFRRSVNTAMELAGVSDNERATLLGHTIQVNKSDSYTARTDQAAQGARAAIAAMRRSS